MGLDRFLGNIVMTKKSIEFWCYFISQFNKFMFPSYQSNKIIFEADENCKNVIELRNVSVFFCLIL